MTPDEQRFATRRLAEAMGWRREGDYWRLPNGGQMPVDGWCPFASLDDARMVERCVIERYGWTEYRRALEDVCSAQTQAMVTATAAQRAEACLRVIEAAKEIER